MRSNELETTAFSLSTILETPNHCIEREQMNEAKTPIQLFHGGIKSGVKVMQGQGAPQWPRKTNRLFKLTPCHPLFTHCCAVKVALYSPSSNNAQRQHREGSYVATFWNINLASRQSRDSILFSLHMDQIQWRLHLYALCPVFPSGFCMLPGHLHLHIQT